MPAPASDNPAYYPTDGVLNWGKFVVCDARTKKESVYEWSNGKYVKRGGITIGQRVVLGEFRSPEAVKYNGLRGYVRSEKDGLYSIHCEGCEGFPYGAMMTCEDCNLFVYGDDGQLYHARPNADRAALEESGKPQYIDVDQYKKIVSVIEECQQQQALPPQVYKSVPLMFPGHAEQDSAPPPSQLSRPAAAPPPPSYPSYPTDEERNSVIPEEYSPKAKSPNPMNVRSSAQQEPPGMTMLPSDVEKLDLGQITRDAGALVDYARTTVAGWFGRESEGAQVGIPKVADANNIEETLLPPESSPTFGAAGGASSSSSGAPRKSELDLQLEAEIAKAQASYEKAQREYEQTKRASEGLALLGKKKKKPQPEGEAARGPSTIVLGGLDLSDDPAFAEVLNNNDNNFVDGEVGALLPPGSATSLSGKNKLTSKQIVSMPMLTMPELKKHRLESKEELLRSQKGSKREDTKSGVAGANVVAGTTLGSGLLQPSSATMLDAPSLHEYAAKEREKFARQEAERQEANRRVQESVMQQQVMYEEMHRRFQVAMTPVDSLEAAPDGIVGASRGRSPGGATTMLQILQPNPEIARTGPSLTPLTREGALNTGARPALTTGDLGHLVPTPRELHSTANRHWGTHIPSGIHKTALAQETALESGVRHIGAGQPGASSSRLRTQSDTVKEAYHIPEHAASIQQQASIRSKSEAPRLPGSGNWRVTRDPDTNRTMFLPAEAPSPEKKKKDPNKSVAAAGSAAPPSSAAAPSEEG